MLTISATATTI